MIKILQNVDVCFSQNFGYKIYTNKTFSQLRMIIRQKKNNRIMIVNIIFKKKKKISGTETKNIFEYI